MYVLVLRPLRAEEADADRREHQQRADPADDAEDVGAPEFFCVVSVLMVP